MSREEKKAGSVVTDADRQVQTFLLDKLEEWGKKAGISFRVVAEENERDLGERIESINRENQKSPFESLAKYG